MYARTGAIVPISLNVLCKVAIPARLVAGNT